jgi:hypothetical protein
MFIYSIKLNAVVRMMMDDVTIPICDGLQLQSLDCTKYETPLISADVGLKIDVNKTKITVF